MLKVNSLWKFYGEDAVLKDISYEFVPGEIYIVAGENGAGKTSLLSVIAGLGAYQEGTIQYQAKKTSNTDPSITWHDVGFDSLKNAEISSAFPLGGCYDHLNVVENLELATPLCPKHKRAQIVQEIIEFFKLEQYATKKYQELSKGYQQRTTLGVAFVNRPNWIILDEPTVYLDHDGVCQLINVLQIFKEFGTSFIISSHDRDFINAFTYNELKLVSGVLC